MIAYLVLAHSNPLHLFRLIAQLASAQATFFVHLDAKSSAAGFRELPDADVRMLRKRIPVYWGEYSMVEAILSLLQAAITAREDYAYCVLLSGADYPIRSTGYIEHFLREGSGTQFMSLAPIPSADAGLPLSKINRLVPPSTHPFMRLAARAISRWDLPRRDYRRRFGSLKPFGGSTWWALTAEACQYVLDFTDQNGALCDYFRWTYSPDETLFHTIIGNSPFRPHVRRSLTYDDWSAGGIHPRRISHHHVDFFEQQARVTLADAFGGGELLFARKFDDRSEGIVVRINTMIAAKDDPDGAVQDDRTDLQPRSERLEA